MVVSPVQGGGRDEHLQAHAGSSPEKMGEDLASSVTTIVEQLRIAAPATELKFLVAGEDGVCESEHSELLASCQVSAFCMAAGSMSAAGFENNEAIN